MRALGITLFALLFMPEAELLSLAPRSGPDAQRARPARAYAPAPKRIDITEGDEVTAGKKAPEDRPIVVAPRAKQPSLLKLRQDFKPEMLKSAEEL